MSVINTNVKSLIAQDSLRANNNKLATAMERLSTGSKINSAKDDAAGLAIGTRMTSQVRGLNMAIKNANDGINLAQTAEGAMTEVTDMLQRMRELAVQAGNSTNTDADRAAMNDEVTQLKAEIDRVAGTTQFNNMNILDGSFAGKLQIGNNANQKMDLAIGSVATTAIGETKEGLAIGATKAKVQIGGASHNVADYQGASFNVNVNGVNKTVTLPVAQATSVQVSGATSATALVGTDAAADVTSKAQVGSFKEKTVDLSVAANAKMLISVNGGADQTIDVSAATYYKDNTKVTGAELVSALQAEFDKNDNLRGVNEIKVGLSNDGNISLTMKSGAVGTIKVSATATEALATTIGGPAAAASVTNSKGQLVLGAQTKDFTSNTAFRVNGHNFDLTAAINANHFDIAAMTIDQFATAYNQTANVNGEQFSTVKVLSNGKLKFDAVPVSSTDSNANGDITAAGQMNIAAATGLSTFMQDTGSPPKFGQYSTYVKASSNDTFQMALNDGVYVNMKLDAGEYLTMQDLAGQVQTQINDSGAFTGDHAVTVTAVQDADKKWGLSFANENGDKIQLKGTFFTAASDLTGAAEVGYQGTAGLKMEGTTPTQISLVDDATAHVITIHGTDFPPSVGTDAFKVRTVDLSNGGLQFEVKVNADAAWTKLNLSKAINDLGFNPTKMTGDQLVQAVDQTFSEAGYAGVNAVTSSIDADGHLQLQVAGSPTPGATPLVKINTAAAATGTLPAVTTTAGNGATAESASIVFDAGGLAAGESLSIGGMTVTNISNAAMTTAAIAAVFANVADGQHPASNTTYSVTGNLTGWKSGAVSAGTTVVFTSTDLDKANVTDIAVALGKNGFLNAVTGAGTALDSGVSGKLVVPATGGEKFGISDLVISSGNANQGLSIQVGSNDKVNLTLTAGTYTDAASLVEEINNQIASSGAFTGSNGLTASVVTDVNGNEGIHLTSATGQSVKLTGGLLKAAVAGGATGGIAKTDLSTTGVTFPGTPVLKGGIDLSGGSEMTLSVTDASGQEFSQTFDLGLSGSHVSFDDYAAAMESAANAAFASDNISFTASVSNGQLSFVVNNASAASYTATGSAISSAFGGNITGTAPTQQLDVNKFTSMADVAAAINEDLGGAAVASYDAAQGWSFTAASGDAGVSSTISLSGAGLSSIQFAGNLSATGEAGNATASKLADVNVLSTASATAALASIDNSIEYVSKQRSMLGAIQNRLEHTVNNLTNIVTNTEASRSAIMDADYSKETTALAKSQILTQAATAMLAQANQSAQGVLSLLK